MKILSWFKILVLVGELAKEMNSVSRDENMTIEEVITVMFKYFNILGIDIRSTNQDNIDKLLKEKLDKHLNQILHSEFRNLVKATEKG
jgi:NTP pyrophosphatase (non-canonical NTP hydrolase)